MQRRGKKNCRRPLTAREATLAQAHPHLAGIGLDLPVVRQHFETYVAQRGLSERLSFHAGDFFADSLPAADVLIMGHVLHDWGLEKKRMLIRKAYAALSRQTAFPYVAWTPG